MTTLSSKIINIHKTKMARIAVDAVLAVADLKRKDVNFDMIKVEGKPGGRLEVSGYVRGAGTIIMFRAQRRTLANLILPRSLCR